LLKDVRYALRMLLKSPGFAAAAIISLALAIGATTTVFSFVNAILLRAIPYANPERLVLLFETNRKEGYTLEARRGFSYPDYTDWRDQSQSFERMAAYAPASFTLPGDPPERIPGELASASYFDMLGAKAAHGRTFTADEDKTPDTHPVAVISHSFWTTRFAADPGALGRQIKLNNRDFTIVGVMPRDFTGLINESQVWVPMMMISAVRPVRTLEQRGNRWHNGVGLLKPGVTVEQAQAEVEQITRNIEQARPDTNADRGGLVAGLRDELFGTIRPILLLLLGAVGFVLLIACANVANLLLVRATNRRRELAVRAALGAGRRRIVQQMLTESVLIALMGGLLGLLLAYLSLNVLKSYVPTQLPSFVNVQIDFRAFAFTLLVSVVTGLIFGLLPALRASRPDLNDVLKESGRGNTGTGRRLRNALVVSEIALTLVLLVGAGLTINSLRQLQQIDLGFTPEGVASLRLDLPAERYPNNRIAPFAQQLVENVRTLPMVKAVSVGSDGPLPLDGDYSATSVTVEGRNPADGEVRIFRHRVTPAYFETMRIPLVKGRDLGTQDAAEAPPVAVVSEGMARKNWPGEDAVGKRIKFGRLEDNNPWITVVGVVRDVKFRTLTEAAGADPDVYFSLAQFPVRGLELMVRTDGDPSQLFNSFRREVLKADAQLPSYNLTTLDQRLARQTAQSRFNVLLLGVFAFIALLLATVGIYGVTSYTVSQRTHEIGIRMALGARGSDIIWLILYQGLIMTAAGLVIGLGVALILSRVMNSLLYGVAATDLTTFAFATVVLAATALIASFVPANRALRVEPVVALRND
jgi:putative ABC transport system permease protein